tara:strand:+ start:10415 stop:10552 length:138 start_codon:yes stop_codon:yes gene_type:complete
MEWAVYSTAGARAEERQNDSTGLPEGCHVEAAAYPSRTEWVMDEG